MLTVIFSKYVQPSKVIVRSMANSEVGILLANLETSNPEMHRVMVQLLELVRKNAPELSEHVKYGGIMFSFNDEDCGGIFASKKHVSFEFSEGYKMNDPESLLNGTGKYRRHLKFESTEDIERQHVEVYVRQMTNT